MGKYSLFKNNCQHFCNNVLTELGLPITRTTCGKETTKVEDVEDVEVDVEKFKNNFEMTTGEDGGMKGP